MSWLAQKIIECLREYVIEFITHDAMGKMINNGFILATVANDTVYVQKAIVFTIALSYVLLVAVTVKQIIDIYGLHTSGDASESPVEVIYRASVSSVMIATSELFFKEFFKFTTLISADVSNLNNWSKETLTAQCRSILDIPTFTVVNLVMVLIILVALIVFYIKAFIRGAQLMLFRILFPVFAVDRSLTNKERWNKFFQSNVSCFLGFIVQLFCFNMFRQSFIEAGTQILSFTWFVAFGWLLMAIKSPNWLDQYVFKSGVGEVLSKSISQAGSILMMRAM